MIHGRDHLRHLADHLRHLADRLSDEQCDNLCRIAEIVCPPPEGQPVELLKCHFCRVGTRRHHAPDLGWIPTFLAPGPAGNEVEVNLPVCDRCKTERLSYNSEAGDWSLRP